MKLRIDSYPTHKAHYLVVAHDKGQGYDPGTSETIIAQFPSRKQAVAARDALEWFGDHRYVQGINFERHWNAVQGSTPDQGAPPPVPIVCAGCLHRLVGLHPQSGGCILDTCTCEQFVA